ncbi:hypothetical protein BSL78_17955 [Apostichopus japonicus]|uniref:Protein RFT1 homolog n=1 Tax=Stichopus japonicus TaxID=307972 RepID=A0A2G8KB17_STIJA|nr:hypothetical protein BSL78_17955 [Apostichopus japonicus]
MGESNNVLASSAMSASYNMVLQIMFRVMTFLLNAFILRNRYVTEDMLGVVNVRLTLLYSTILFVAREAFRRACLSQKESQKWQQTINLIWCNLPLGIISGAVFGFVWSTQLETPDPEVIPHYHLAVLIFATSAVLELLAEPLWVLGQAFLFVKLKVLIEGIAIAGRCLLTVVLVVFFPQLGILAFCFAQDTYMKSFVSFLFVGFFIYFLRYIIHSPKKDDEFPLKKIQDFFPRRIPNEPWTSYELALLTWSFFKQGFLKQLLTEGIYDTINNLGSLAARFIFLPIEESGYLFFAQTLIRDVDVNKQPKESIDLASSVLKCLLKVVVLIGVIIWVFGAAYSYLLLDIYAGSLLSTEPGPTLLKWFSFYVLLLAINGTTECFVFAAMSQEQVDRYNKKMLLFSILFLISSWYLTKTIGSVGFILANCLNMSARISHSIYFTRNYFKDSSYRPLRGLIPSWPVLAVCILSYLVTKYSESQFCCERGWLFRFVHIGVGGVCLLLVIATILITEKELISFITEQWRTRQKSKVAENTKSSTKDRNSSSRGGEDAKKSR